jgi:esterase/lipase superfamily enzyme
MGYNSMRRFADMISKPSFHRRPPLVLLLCLGVSACAGRPGPDVLATTAPAKEASRTVTVYAATTRARSVSGTNVYGNERARQTNFASFDISLPADHAAGSIEWPRGRPDATTSFAVIRQSVLRNSEFERAAAAGRHARATIFVHGYNYNYQEALFRLAQMTADANQDRLPVLFAWPSVASARGYLADREGATFSRDNLAELIVDLGNRRSRGEVTVFAHSMGAWLTMEALRQLSLQGRTDALSKLNVVLAAPDIDADVFDTQARMIKGKLARPLTVLVSKDDRALRASSLLSTGQPKIGALDVESRGSQEIAGKNDVMFIDISSVSPTGAMKHDRYIDLTTLIPQLRRGDSAFGALEQAGAFVFRGAESGTNLPLQLAGPGPTP